MAIFDFDPEPDLDRIADALERLVIAADSIATALSLQALNPPRKVAEAIAGQRKPHQFEPHPDLAWLCKKCGQEEDEDWHKRPLPTGVSAGVPIVPRRPGNG